MLVKSPRKVGKAHRISYELNVGPIPDGLNVLHHCDNPPCVNPAHLWVGTHADNVADKVAKGRQRWGMSGYGRHGETHPTAKLTEEQAVEARALYGAGVSQAEIAGRFGVSQPTIFGLVSGRTWKHLGPPISKPRGHNHVGAKNGRSKITEADVREMRRAYVGGETQTSIAARYGMSQVTVSKIVRHESWRHVDG